MQLENAIKQLDRQREYFRNSLDEFRKAELRHGFLEALEGYGFSRAVAEAGLTILNKIGYPTQARDQEFERVLNAVRRQFLSEIREAAKNPPSWSGYFSNSIQHAKQAARAQIVEMIDRILEIED